MPWERLKPGKELEDAGRSSGDSVCRMVGESEEVTA